MAEIVEAPLSFYLDLEPGSVADLEVVARAALAWVSAIKEAAYIVDPSIEISVELLDGERSSLRLNTLLKVLDNFVGTVEAGADRYPHLKALAKALAFVVISTPLAVTAEDIYRAIIGDDNNVVELSHQSKAELIEEIRRALKPDVATRQKEEIFVALAKDPSVKAVGVTSNPSKRPSILIERADYLNWVNSGTSLEVAETSRVREEVWPVTLISPVLQNAERSWKFMKAGLPEFGAVMKDKAFLEAMAHGQLHVELRQGIEMTVRIEIKEKYVGGVWIPIERSIVEVIKPTFFRSGIAF